MPETAAQLTTQTHRWNYAKRSKNAQLPIGLIIQIFLLYQPSCVLAADLCSAWSGFEGIGAQIPQRPAALNLSVVETVGVSLTSRDALSVRLTEKGRRRPTGEAESATLPSVEQPTPGGKLSAKRLTPNLHHLRTPRQAIQLAANLSSRRGDCLPIAGTAAEALAAAQPPAYTSSRS